MSDPSIVCFKLNEVVSPTVYIHWDCGQVEKWINECMKLMSDRPYDISYIAARFVGIVCKRLNEEIPNSNTGIGLYPTEESDYLDFRRAYTVILPEFKIVKES